jgi:integrase
MKKHLTDAAVQRFKPPTEGVLEIFDLGYPGLALRIGHGGSKSFEQFYRVGNKLKRETLGRWPGTSLAAAREAWRQTRETLAKGEVPRRESAPKTDLFEVVVEEWLRRDQSTNKPSTYYFAVRTVEHDLLPAWRGKRVDEIGKRDILELIDAINDRGAPVKAARVFTLVRRFFRWCGERDILSADPSAGMPKVASGKSRERVLSDDELVRVWNALEGPLAPAIKLLILTGARREEIAQLRWSEIDGDVINLRGDRTKNGEAHIIPLSMPAREILANQPRIAGCDFVFTVSGTKPVSGWSRYKPTLDAASGTSDWVVHDLRRSVATGLQKLGVSLQTVEAILGHTAGSRGGIVGIYQRHNFADEKRAALEAWAEYLRGKQISFPYP